MGAGPGTSHTSFDLEHGVEVKARKFDTVLVVNVFDAIGGWCSIVYVLDSDGDISSMGELKDPEAVKIKEVIEGILRL
jgi:ABC-type proline/glycine betaine transport system substrate-binding protein